MKANTMLSKVILTAIASAILSMTAAQGAEHVHRDDLANRIGHLKGRQYRIVTKSGTSYLGHMPVFSSTHVKLTDGGQWIALDEVTQIRIHRETHLRKAILAPGRKIIEAGIFFGCTGDWCFPVGGVFIPVVIPVALASIPAAAPIVLPIEGIKRLLPDRVIDVEP